MIDKSKLSESDLKAMENHAVVVRGLFDEANLLAQELHIKPEALPLVTLLLFMMKQGR